MLRYVVPGLAVVLGLGAYLWLSSSGSGQGRGFSPQRARLGKKEQPPPERPREAPVLGRDEPFSLPDPSPPPDMAEVKHRALEAARAAEDPHPAETALRTAVKAYVAHNRQFADAQAQAEGLSLQEVEELTYFGFMAQQTQRWPEVEEVLGGALDAETKQAAERLLVGTNQRFKKKMRSLVKEGAPEDQRWDLIRQTQADYKAAYYRLTGMNDSRLNDLLAGDVTRAYPPGEMPPPETLAQQQEAAPEPDKPRPQAPPPPDRVVSEEEP